MGVGGEKKEMPAWEITIFIRLGNGKIRNNSKQTTELLELRLFAKYEMSVIAITLFLSRTWEPQTLTKGQNRFMKTEVPQVLNNSNIFLKNYGKRR